MNRKYGKVDSNHDIIYAPDIVAHDGRSYIGAKDEDYAIADDGPWLPIIEKPSLNPAPEGYHWKNTGKYDVNDNGNPVARYVLEEDDKPTVSDYDAIMEEYLVRERSERGYTTREPDRYQNSQVPRWVADARDWVAHRDDVMLYALDIMNRVSAGEPAPTIEEFEAGLPKIIWSYTED